MKYLPFIVMFLFGCTQSPYSHVSKEGCATIANNMANVAMARDLGIDKQEIIQANKEGIHGCWVKDGKQGCAIQDEEGVTWITDQVNKVYASKDDPETIAHTMFEACQKEKGNPKLPTLEDPYLPKGQAS